MRKNDLITDEYCLTKDIDWFCIINNIPIHVASNGGDLPSFVKKKGLKELRSELGAILDLSFDFKYELNKEFIQRFVVNTGYEYLEENPLNIDIMDFHETLFVHNETRAIRLYSYSFIEMACRGFYSFDRNEDSNLYHLVAAPSNGYLKECNIDLPKISSLELDFNDLSSLNKINLIEIIENGILECF